MRQRLIRCGDQVNEMKAIEIMVDNSNDAYKNVLSARTFQSVAHLVQHAEYLVRGKPRRVLLIVKNVPRSYGNYNRQAKVDTILAAGNDEDDPVEKESSRDSEEDFLAQIDALITNRRVDYRSPRIYGSPVKNQKDAKLKNVSEGKNSKQVEADAIMRPLLCSNCIKWGHTWESCVEKKKKRCWECGTEDSHHKDCRQYVASPSKN